MSEHPISDEHFYEQAATELRDNTFRPGLMAKAFAEADGNQDRAEATYLRLRVAEMLKEQSATAAPTSKQGSIAAVEVEPPHVLPSAAVGVPSSASPNSIKEAANARPILEPSSDRRSRLTSFPVLLFVTLLIFEILLSLDKSPIILGVVARAVGICILPLVAGVIWLVPGPNYRWLKYIFFALTCIMWIAAIMSLAQQAKENIAKPPFATFDPATARIVEQGVLTPPNTFDQFDPKPKLASIITSSARTEPIEVQLKRSADEARKSLPMLVSEDVQATNIVAVGKILVHRYNFTSRKPALANVNAVKAQYNEASVNAACTNPDTLKAFNSGVSADYQFYDSNNEFVMQYTIDAKVCQLRK